MNSLRTGSSAAWSGSRWPPDIVLALFIGQLTRTESMVYTISVSHSKNR